MPNRRVPLSLSPRLKTEVYTLTQLGVISPVEEPLLLEETYRGSTTTARSVCIADDVVVHSRDTEEHDRHMNMFLLRCRERGVTFNREKLETKVESLTFMGRCVSQYGLSIDPSKLSSMRGMKEPCYLDSPRRCQGWWTYSVRQIMYDRWPPSLDWRVLSIEHWVLYIILCCISTFSLIIVFIIILPRMVPSRMVMERPLYLVTCLYHLNVLVLSIASMHNVFLLSSEIQGILLPSHPVTCVHHVSDRNLPTSNIKTYIFSYYQWKYSKFN